MEDFRLACVDFDAVRKGQIGIRLKLSLQNKIANITKNRINSEKKVKK